MTLWHQDCPSVANPTCNTSCQQDYAVSRALQLVTWSNAEKAGWAHGNLWARGEMFQIKKGCASPKSFSDVGKKRHANKINWNNIAAGLLLLTLFVFYFRQTTDSDSVKKRKENLINFPRRGGNTGRICISTTLLRQKRWLSLAGRSPHPSSQMCGPWPPRWSSSPNTSHGWRGFCLKRLKFSQTAAGCKKADWRVVMRITVAGCCPTHSRAGQVLGLKEQNTDELLPSVLQENSRRCNRRQRQRYYQGPGLQIEIIIWCHPCSLVGLREYRMHLDGKNQAYLGGWDLWVSIIWCKFLIWWTEIMV